MYIYILSLSRTKLTQAHALSRMEFRFHLHHFHVWFSSLIAQIVNCDADYKYPFPHSFDYCALIILFLFSILAPCSRCLFCIVDWFLSFSIIICFHRYEKLGWLSWMHRRSITQCDRCLLESARELGQGNKFAFFAHLNLFWINWKYAYFLYT